MIEAIKKAYPIVDENGNSATYPTFASQVFMDDGTSVDKLINTSVGYMVMNRINFNVPADGWTQTETGRYTQIIPVTGINVYSHCYHIDLDMSAVTEETVEDIKSAWSLIDNAETVNGGIMLTSFTEAPSVDFPVITDVQMRITDIPSAQGVGF